MRSEADTDAPHGYGTAYDGTRDGKTRDGETPDDETPDSPVADRTDTFSEDGTDTSFEGRPDASAGDRTNTLADMSRGAPADPAMASGFSDADEDRIADEDRAVDGDRALDGDRAMDEDAAVRTTAVGTAAVGTAAVPDRAVRELRPGEAAQEVPTIASTWQVGQADDYRERWRQVQVRFLDDPQDAADEAERLVGEVLDSLAQVLSGRKSTLDSWRSSDRRDTEELRVTVRGYRDLLERALAL
jgi:hypothetical protein